MKQRLQNFCHLHTSQACPKLVKIGKISQKKIGKTSQICLFDKLAKLVKLPKLGKKIKQNKMKMCIPHKHVQYTAIFRSRPRTNVPFYQCSIYRESGCTYHAP